MKENNDSCHEEFTELKELLASYEAAGIRITLSGRRSTAQEAAYVCAVKERGAYMSDFIPDNNGRLREIRFDRVKKI